MPLQSEACGQQHRTEDVHLAFLEGNLLQSVQDLLWLIKFADAGGKEHHFGAEIIYVLAYRYRLWRSPLLVQRELLLRISRGLVMWPLRSQVSATPPTLRSRGGEHCSVKATPSGLGVPQNYAEAARWLRKAAEI